MFTFVDHGLHQVRRQNTPNLPLRYRTTNDDQRYLLCDRIQRVDGVVDKRIIVYATDEQPRLLFTSPHIMMDDTFDTCPPHFDQIYSIHALKGNQSKLLSSYLNMIVA